MLPVQTSRMACLAQHLLVCVGVWERMCFSTEYNCYVLRLLDVPLLPTASCTMALGFRQQGKMAQVLGLAMCV